MYQFRVLFIAAILSISLLLLSCDKTSMEITYPEEVEKGKDEKPDFPVQTGTIRGYFGNDYKIFIQHIEKVQPVDSFSNCYFYGACTDDYHQINLIRCDNDYVLAIYILGCPLDSLPMSNPVPIKAGRFAEIQYYPFSDWNSTAPNHHTINSFYGQNVFISEITDDIVTGTFEGSLHSPGGGSVVVTEGEFKLKLFRKNMPCGEQ